jgi:hypothetical protein
MELFGLSGFFPSGISVIPIVHAKWPTVGREKLKKNHQTYISLFLTDSQK